MEALLDRNMVTNEDIWEDYTTLAELENLFNEAWANGYIDGYVSVIRKQPDYSEHCEGYEGRLLEEYESGFNSAKHDNVKWTRKYAWARGYLDGHHTSELEWNEFGFLAFWGNDYTGELLKIYNEGYYAGFFEDYSKQRDYEWALGFLNQLRKLQARISILPRVSLYEKDYHNDHGHLYYPAAYEEGYEAARTFCQYDTIDEAENAANFTKKTQWTIGFIDGKFGREERFGVKLDGRNPSQPRTIFDKCCLEYDDGYKAGSGELIEEMLNKGMNYWKYNSSQISIEITEDEKDKNLIWGTGYVDGRMYGIFKYRGYNDAEKAIYKEGYDIGISDLKRERFCRSNNASVTIYSVEDKGYSDAINYNRMINHGYDRIRFHAYRKGFYREILTRYTLEKYSSESIGEDIAYYLKSFKLPQSSNYINNKLDAWKLGVKSGFTGYSARPNNNIFFCADDNSEYSLNDESFAHNIESDLYNSYKEGCRFGYEHTFFYRWDLAYEAGFSDGDNYASEGTIVNMDFRSKFKGFELEAYDKGFSDALDIVEKSKNHADDNSSYEWTKEDAWDAMTDGMYGDYKGDVDFDKFGF